MARCGFDLRREIGAALLVRIGTARGERASLRNIDERWHDAWDLLPAIRTPSLLIGGGCDRFTPAHLAERMAKTLPVAEYELLPDATHFGLLEEPDAIAARIARFADERLRVPEPR